jgi:prepilin-type processing-associated H-X9-DG protein
VSEAKSALPVVDYSTPPPANPNAKRALIFGLLAFLPFVPAILAIRYGRRGQRDVAADPRVGGSGAALAGIVLGILSLVVWVTLSALAVPATINARRQALRVQCMSQLRQVGMGALMYANANGGYLPQTLDQIVAAKLIPARLLQCPACAGDPRKPVASSGAYGNYHYVYLGAGRHTQGLRTPATIPLAYEPVTNHADLGINVLYADGHVALMRGPNAAALIQQMNATTQPAGAAPPTAPAVEN